MTENWLRDNRYLLAVGAITLSVVFVLIIPLAGYIFHLWSPTVSRLLMAGLGGLGTILLAILTFLTLLDNRVLVQERLKEREKPLQRDMLEKIIWPAFDALAENKRKLNAEIFNWLNADFEDESEFVNVNLELIGERGDPVTSDRFAETYPEVADKMSQYDQYLARLDKCAYEYVNQTREPIADYLHSENIEKRTTAIVGTTAIVETDEVLNYLLVGDKPARDGDRPDWWTKHKQEFKRIAAENAGEYYDKFYELRNKVFNYSNEVRRSLVEVRKDIESEYGIFRE